MFTRDITDQALWSSNSPTVAFFDPAKSPNRVTGGNAPGGTAVITATVGGAPPATYSLTVSPTTINTMTISPVNPSVASGFTTQFAVVGTFQDNTTQDLTFDATWTATPISSPIAASVSDDPASKGLAKGLAVGSATITASFGTSPNIATAFTTLSVTPAILQSIAVTPTNSSVDIFTSPVGFKATGTYSDGTTLDITTSTTWSSSQTGIATIDAATGVATTVAAGSTSISAAKDGISANTNLTVKDFTLSFTSSVSTMKVGDKVNFKLTATTVGGVGQDVTSGSTWESSAVTVATVGNSATDKGLVTGVLAGSTIITAKFGGRSVTASILVQ